MQTCGPGPAVVSWSISRSALAIRSRPTTPSNRSGSGPGRSQEHGSRAAGCRRCSRRCHGTWCAWRSPRADTGLAMLAVPSPPAPGGPILVYCSCQDGTARAKRRPATGEACPVEAGMAPTLREVAARAGVSIRTASNVVNEFARVAPETRARVQRVLDELGYSPNAAARTLRRGRSGLIALVLPELDIPYFAELTRAVIAEAARHRYTVVIDQTDGDRLRERELIMRGSRAALFDGLIFSPLGLGGSDLRDRTSTAPVVLLGERIVDSGLDHVMIDNVAASRAATRHLLELGRRRIAVIGDQPGETFQTAR